MRTYLSNCQFIVSTATCACSSLIFQPPFDRPSRGVSICLILSYDSTFTQEECGLITVYFDKGSFLPPLVGGDKYMLGRSSDSTQGRGGC